MVGTTQYIVLLYTNGMGTLLNLVASFNMVQDINNNLKNIIKTCFIIYYGDQSTHN